MGEKDPHATRTRGSLSKPGGEVRRGRSGIQIASFEEWRRRVSVREMRVVHASGKRHRCGRGGRKTEIGRLGSRGRGEVLGIRVDESTSVGGEVSKVS